MPTATNFATFTLACLVLALIPGPSLLFTVGRAISAGRGTAIRSVAGNACGLYTQAVVVALGLGPILAASDTVFMIMKVAGACYLVWLAVHTWRHRSADDVVIDEGGAVPGGLRTVWSGFVVGLTNPKVLAFLVALLPQFVEPGRGPVAVQMLLLALVLMVVGFCVDASVALAAARARAWFTTSPQRLRRMKGAGAAMMGALGLSLLLTSHPQ